MKILKKLKMLDASYGNGDGFGIDHDTIIKNIDGDGSGHEGSCVKGDGDGSIETHSSGDNWKFFNIFFSLA